MLGVIPDNGPRLLIECLDSLLDRLLCVIEVLSVL